MQDHKHAVLMAVADAFTGTFDGSTQAADFATGLARKRVEVVVSGLSVSAGERASLLDYAEQEIALHRSEVLF